MSRAQRPFVRIYYVDLQRDYHAVLYDPTALATYTRLLIIADQAWPAKPVLPKAVRQADLKMLAVGDLVTVGEHDTYTIKGYHKDRAARAKVARDAVGKRKDRRTTKVRTSVVPTYNERTTNTNTSTNTSTESANALSYDGERMGTPSLDEQAIRVLVARTGEPWSRAGDKQLGEYDRLIGAHGLPAVEVAFDRISAGKRMTARQLVWAAVKLLEPIPSGKDTRAADAAEAAEKRSRRIDAEMQARRTEAERWVETA